MNGNEYILAFADIQDDLIHSASDDTAVRKVFRRYKSRRNKTISALCCCIVIAMVAVGFGSQKWFGKTPAVILNDTTTANHLPTEPNETQPSETQPGVIPQETKNLPDETTQSTHETPSVSQEQPAPTAQTPSVSNSEPSVVTPENGTEPTAPIPVATTDPTTVPDGEVVYHLLYTYVIVSTTFSDYQLGKAVGEEMVGQRLEDTAATGVYVHSDGTTQEDETLRCEICALAGVDPGIAVCVRFIDRGKGLKTDRYYLLYHPNADMSAIEAYLNP